MKKLTAIFCLTITVLYGATGCQTSTVLSYSGQSGGSLRPCTGHPESLLWTYCRGSYRLSNGESYVGDIINGKPGGKGEVTFSAPHPDAGQKLVGEFTEGKLLKGTVTNRRPHIYAGLEKSGKFLDGKLYGNVIVIWRVPHALAGQKYTGEARDNKRHGQGVQTYPKGGVDEGIWQDGRFIKPQKTTSEFLAKSRKEIASLKNQNQSKPKQVAKRPEPKKSPPPKSGYTGSGFFVSKLGHIITNEHVVRQCGSVTVGDNANKQISASILEKDKRNDLALLRISSTEMASAETKSLISKLGAKKLGLKLVPLASGGLMRSDDIELGESVMVAGYPYGELYSNTIKVTGGMVSAVKGMGDDSAQFQMDAAVQPGNSGGPIYDENGNIVGVVISQLNKLKVAKTIGSLPENVNFGIKASTVRQFLTSAGLPTKWSNRTKRKSTKELAQIAKNQTVMVVCNP